jgi:uncharacterized membrane protein YgdD (TMEM256/DUF423 family)
MNEPDRGAGRRWLRLGALSGFTAVGLGAFGAHALKARLTPEMLAIFETGVRYQMYHALALLAVGILANRPGHLPAGAASVSRSAPWSSAALSTRSR